MLRGKFMNFKLFINGMSCKHCEERISASLNHLKLNITEISYEKGFICYDANNDKTDEIKEALRDTEYTVAIKRMNKVMTIGLYLTVIVLFILIANKLYNQFGVISLENPFAYISIFVFGLVTSLHCIGMCGGIALSQTDFDFPIKNIKRTISYNFSRILTYSVIGSVLGFLGGQIGISDNFRTIMFFIIGLVMLLMGLNNLGIVKFRLKVLGFNFNKTSTKSPFIIGIMNGFMPCGPLQTMHLLALTSGSFMAGFFVMFSFGVGTIPLMMLFSNLGLFIKKKHQKNIAKASAVMVILMSFVIFSQGFNSLGITVDQDRDLPYAEIVDGYQVVNILVDPYYEIDQVRVKKDIPVKLSIHVKSISGCTANITVPKFDLNTDLIVGETHDLIFTPTEKETIKITCWMSMVNAYLDVN